MSDRRGRPQKLTLDFFLHDKDARRDRKIRALRKKHGNDGYATFFCLLEMICDEDGLRLNLANSVDLEIAVEDCGLRDDAHFYKVLHTCVDIGLFDKQMWESERIVFSHALYRRYLDRLEERKQAAIRKKRSRDAKSLQTRISDAESRIVTRDNCVTNDMSRDGHGIVTPQNYRTTELQISELTELQNNEEELRSSLPEESGVKSEQDEKPVKKTAEQIKRDWLLNVFVLNYPARLNEESGTKTRAVGAIKRDAKKYFKYLRAEDVESDLITNALRSLVGVKLAEYRQKYKQDPPRLKFNLPDGSEKWVWALPFIPDPANWLKDQSWLNEIEEGAPAEEKKTPVLSNGEIDWSQHPERDHWLVEMREKGNRFYSDRSGGIDQEKHKFFRKHLKEVFPDALS